MRTIILILLLGFIANLGQSQVNVAVAEKRNSFNEKANYYFDKGDYKKAIVYYNMAFQNDATDYFSVLKKAEAYTKLKLFSQAEECYRAVFESNQRLDNAYKLKYALVLLANNKIDDFAHWLNEYSRVVDAELQGENYIVSKENRIKLYKDTSIVLVKSAGEIKESAELNNYKAKINSSTKPQVSIEGFSSKIQDPTYNSNNTVMYFVSDATGGIGGEDIYTSKLIKNNWSKPENLGNVINTSGNEISPCLMNDSILYFSSNGHGGCGGLDIFSVNINSTNKKVTTLGSQINSPFDDYNLFLSTKGQSGYFCSNRPATKPNKDNIYWLGIYNFKTKYAAYQPRKKSTTEDAQLNILNSSGDEYNISPINNQLEFSFQPMESYRLILQKENITLDDLVNNKSLSPDKRKELTLNPAPLQKAEVKLQPGMKYKFTAGQNTLSDDYKKALKDKASKYQTGATGNINLSALAKELKLNEGDIYTIRFVKDNNKVSEVSNLMFNDKNIGIYGQTLFMVFPLKTESTFNIQTDLETLDKNFSSKKYGLTVDDSPVFKKDAESKKWLLSLKVNTATDEGIKPENQYSASEISIIPGLEYILTLSKPGAASAENQEIVVPLTRGVKYNLSSSKNKSMEFKKELAEVILNRKGLELANEEVIDISILSKELEVKPGEDLLFTLMPAKQLGKKVQTDNKTVLNLDGEDVEINPGDKYSVNVPFNPNNSVNLQTDLEYVKTNFKAEDYTLKLDTVSFTSEITVDTTGYKRQRELGWLQMSVNTDLIDEVQKQDQFTASDVSIITGKEYILTVTKTDAATGKKDEIIVPLLRNIKYDFTSKPKPEEAYKQEIDEFMAGRKDIETDEGTVIDITLLSKELSLEEGDEVVFSLLPVKRLSKNPTTQEVAKSSLYLDNKVVEFTQIQKYSINMPLNENRQVNMQTNIEYLEKNFEPTSFAVDLDTAGFFSEITVDTTGYGQGRLEKEGIIKDPVYDIVIVNFNMNEYALSADAKKIILEKVANELKADSRLYVTIKGYTDALGDAQYNLNLSKKRAESVKDFLKGNGIGDNRIRTLSFGAGQLLEKGIDWKDMSESELRKYRKVEISIYMPYK
jgi:outer membrane protein OmpA-like peptidoglycan-associated protein/tetratricopeptide (TPR) repeat protein